MPLSENQEALEPAWKLAQMEADGKLKEAQTRKSEQDWRLDPQRMLIQVALASAAIMGAIAGVLGFFIGRGSGH